MNSEIIKIINLCYKTLEFLSTFMIKGDRFIILVLAIEKLIFKLQDIYFKNLFFDKRLDILGDVKNIYGNHQLLVREIINKFDILLLNNNIKIEMSYRVKSSFSIWMKMLRKNLSLKEVEDVIAFRIIVNNREECYTVLSTIRKNYRIMSESEQDFISTPKHNGYESIHIIIVDSLKRKIELQIRTWDMHILAEFGNAAHWKYKQFQFMNHINILNNIS